MEDIIDMKSLLLYKKAAKLLEENDVKYNKSKLLKDPGLCLDIINILSNM